jgi:cbb3-type cytochrome oxidase subunit 3
MNSSMAHEQTTRAILADRDGTNPPDYGTLRKTARLAGLLYFFLALMGAYAIMYVPSKIIVEGNAAATANNLLTYEFLFRTGIVSALGSSILFLFLVAVLYRLFKQVNERQAKLMVALVALQIPIGFVLEAFEVTTLMILKDEALQGLAPAQRQDMGMLFFEIARSGSMILEIFWGLWLLPFGRLVYQSGFIPRILGVFLMLTGTAYLIDSLTFLLFPGYKDMVQSYVFPLFFGEVAIMLWLLIKGVRTPVGQATTAPPAVPAS